MIHYVTYENATGRVLKSGWCRASDLSLQAGTGETAIEEKAKSVNDATHYYPAGVKTARAALSVTWSPTSKSVPADDTTELEISGLPNDAIVFVDEEEYAASSTGVFTMTFDTPGTYRIRVDEPAYKPGQWEVTAT